MKFRFLLFSGFTFIFFFIFLKIMRLLRNSFSLYNLSFVLYFSFLFLLFFSIISLIYLFFSKYSSYSSKEKSPFIQKIILFINYLKLPFITCHDYLYNNSHFYFSFLFIILKYFVKYNYYFYKYLHFSLYIVFKVLIIVFFFFDIFYLKKIYFFYKILLLLTFVLLFKIFIYILKDHCTQMLKSVEQFVYIQRNSKNEIINIYLLYKEEVSNFDFLCFNIKNIIDPGLKFLIKLEEKSAHYSIVIWYTNLFYHIFLIIGLSIILFIYN